jgi:hypothetical protein
MMASQNSQLSAAAVAWRQIRALRKGSHNNYFGSSGRVAGSAGVARIV